MTGPLRAILLGGVAFFAAFNVHAQGKFPVKPIRIIVALTAGSTPDMLARIIGQKMTGQWG